MADFAERGFHRFPQGVDASAAARLNGVIRATRRFDESLFLTEAEFDADPRFTGVNPRPGCNLLERFAPELAFVEEDASLVHGLEAILGPDRETLLKKVICGVPASILPDWIRRRIEGNPVNNLGAYVRPQFRDVTYFYGIDFHQDLIDHPDREADFVTLYVYLHDVGEREAPLYVLEGSHRLGGSLFPHDLLQSGDRWLYRDGRGGEEVCRQTLLTGPVGTAALWHACTLHGTQPGEGDRVRLSLRYLIARRPGGGAAGVDAVNATLAGPLSLAATRRDLDAAGAAAVKSNAVLAARPS